MKKYFLAIAVLTILFSGNATSQDVVTFQTTSEEMVKELTREPVKYRSIFQKKRAIQVVKKENNVVQESTVMITEGQDVPKLKLKIEFDYNSAALKGSSYQILQEVGQALTSDSLSHKTILINGHTDSDGTDAYNLQLSYKRAESVKSYLISEFNIPSHKLQVQGFGEGLPLLPNTNSGNKQINRRVEFELGN